MDWREMEVLLTLADEQHFARTAQRLAVAPASVTQTVQKIERRLGVTLFRRTTRRVEVTAEGAELIGSLRPAFDQIERAVARAVAIGRRAAGELSIGYLSAAAGTRLMEIVGSFRRAVPAAEIHVQEATFAGNLERLRGGEVDLAVLPLPVDVADLVCGPVIGTESAMLAVGAGHRLAHRSAVEAGDIGRETFVVETAVPADWLEAHLPACPPARIRAVATYQEILMYVAEGQGVAIVGEQTPRLYPRPGVNCLPIGGVPGFDYALISPRAPKPFAQAFVDYVRAHPSPA